MNKFSLTNNHSKWLFLILLLVIVGLITYYRVRIQMELGPGFDTFDFLSDAAEFAGKIGYTDLNRPPFLSLLTAVFFIFGNLSVTPIFIVDGLLSLVGCIGFYLLLKERLSSVVSFVGTLLFATFPIVITFTGAGFNDVSSVGVAIWAIYLTFLAVEKNSKWFYLSFPVAMLAFLTRYNMALIIFPIFLYIFINWEKIKNRKDILIGIGLSLLVILPFIIYLWMKFGNPLYSFMNFFGTSGATAGSGGNPEHFAYNPDQLYYLENLQAYIGVQSLMVIFLTLLGSVIYLFRKWRETRQGSHWLTIKINNSAKAKLALLVVLIIILLVTFGKIHYLITEMIFFVLAYLTYMASKDLGLKDWRTDFLFFSWFMAFFIFQSIYVVKDHRYFITMAPPVAYFLARAFNWAASQMKVKFKDKNLTLYLGAIILTLLMIFSTINQLPGIEKNNEKSKLFNQDAQQASYWLINHDPQYKSKVIYADLWPYFAWYLQTDVGMMPIFRNNQILYDTGPKDYNFTEADNIALNNELEKLKPDYYISAWKRMTFTSYEPIQTFGNITIFKRKM